MRRRRRAILAVAVALTATLAVAASTMADGSRPSASDRDTVVITTPAGSTLTMEVMTPRPGRWCARVTLDTTSGSRLTHRACGAQRPPHNLHGEFIADCERRELIAFGPTPRSANVPGATLTRLARGRSIYLAVLAPGVPLTAVGRAGTTVDTVDFGTWDGDCASSWYLSGAF